MQNHKQQSHQPKTHSGVTLIEMTVTVFLIGVLAAIASPNIMSSVSYHRLEAASAQIAADIEMARQHAKTASKSQTISFNVAQNNYSMAGLKHINHPGIDYVVDLDDLNGSVSLTSVNFSSATTVTFDMYGHPDSGGTIVVQTGSEVRTITVEGSTGKVTVQ